MIEISINPLYFLVTSYNYSHSNDEFARDTVLAKADFTERYSENFMETVLYLRYLMDFCVRLRSHVHFYQ